MSLVTHNLQIWCKQFHGETRFLFTEKHCISVQKKVFLITDKVVRACDNVA